MIIRDKIDEYRQILAKLSNDINKVRVTSEYGCTLETIRSIMGNLWRAPIRSAVDFNNYRETDTDNICYSELFIIFSLLYALDSDKIVTLTSDMPEAFEFGKYKNKIVLIQNQYDAEVDATYTNFFEVNKTADIPAEEKFHQITRFKDDVNLDRLVELYGERLFIRMSSKCFYDRFNKSIIIVARDLNDNSRLFTPNGRKFFIRNNKEMLKEILTDEIIEAVENATTGNVEFNFNNIFNKKNDEILQLYTKLISSKFDEYKNKNIMFLDELEENVSGIRDLIGKIESEIERDKNAINTLSGSLSSDKADKIITFLRNQIKRGIVHDFDIIRTNVDNSDTSRSAMVNGRESYPYDNDSSNDMCTIRVHTNWLFSYYTDTHQLSAFASSRGEFGRAIRKFILPADSSNPEGLCNGLFAMLPTTILFYIDSYGRIHHRFIGRGLNGNCGPIHSDSFEAELEGRLINRHAHYNCLGSFGARLEELSSTGEYARYISNILQYYQTLAPGDSAGDRTMENCPIVDYKTGKILYVQDDTREYMSRLLAHSYEEFNREVKAGEVYINLNYVDDLRANGANAHIFKIVKPENKTTDEAEQTENTAVEAESVAQSVAQ